MQSLCRAIWISSAIAIVAMTIFFASQPVTVSSPEPMSEYVSSDGSLRLQHPANWRPRKLPSSANEMRLGFEPAKDARMVITLDLQGSFVVDVLKSQDIQNNRIAGMVPGAGALIDRQMSPLVNLHAAQGAQIKGDTAEYPAFEDGNATPVQIGGREALVTPCTWRSPGFLGSRPIVGRRVTMLCGNLVILI